MLTISVYDRFITIWLENTDFSAAVGDPGFQKLASQGILLTNYNGVTHPSEPNYVAASESSAACLFRTRSHRDQASRLRLVPLRLRRTNPI